MGDDGGGEAGDLGCFSFGLRTRSRSRVNYPVSQPPRRGEESSRNRRSPSLLQRADSVGTLRNGQQPCATRVKSALSIKTGRLNDRGYSVQPPQLQSTARCLIHLELTARWLVLVAWVAGLDASAVNWTITARKAIVIGRVGAGGYDHSHYRGYDASEVTVSCNQLTGETTVRWTRPPTTTGRCYVWWPALAGGMITLVAIALAATRNGRRLVVEFPLPRMTTRRLMIAVAVIGIEAALITSVAGKLGGDPRSSPWPQIVFCLAVPPTLVFLPAFGSRLAPRPEKSPLERKQ
jgi:hypothetical protein